MSGPAIRYLNFYAELSKKHDVRILTPQASGNLVRAGDTNHNTLKNSIKWCDVIITQGLTLLDNPILKKTDKPLVIDLYDPFVLENLEVRKNTLIGQAMYESDLSIIREQLSVGDYFICSNERQFHFWAGCIAISGVVNPSNYESFYSPRNWIGIVPFGMPNEPPDIKERRAIRGSIAGIKNDDFVAVWGGGLWPWLDFETVIKAFLIIRDSGKPIKLLVMGAADNFALAQKLNMLGLLNTHIYLGPWIRYQERHRFLLDADLGIITHYPNWETEFSHRTRILDYLWCDLPFISTEGDYMSGFAYNLEIGITVEPQNEQQLAEYIIELYIDRSKLSRMKNAIGPHKQQLTWSATIKPLDDFCSNPMKRIRNRSIRGLKLAAPIVNRFKRLWRSRT